MLAVSQILFYTSFMCDVELDFMLIKECLIKYALSSYVVHMLVANN